MISLINFLVSTEAIMAYIVILCISISYILYYIGRKHSHKRLMKKNTEELKNLVNDVKELEKEITIPNEVVNKPIPEVIETKEEKEEIFEIKIPFDSIVIEDTAIKVSKDEPLKDKETGITYAEQIAPKEEEAKKELEEVVSRLEEAQNEDRNIELTEFERMQEDTAIISLDELMKRQGQVYEQNEEYRLEDEGNEPITLEEFEQRRNKEEVKKELTKEEIEEPLDIVITPLEEREEISTERKFKSSPVISPVYGIKKDEATVNDIELENTANYEKLDEEIRKTNEFIATLKELQKKLD